MSEKKKTKIPTFKVGDRVRVLRKVKDHARGWENSWVDEMDKAVGKIGTVMSVNYNHFNHDIQVYVPEVGDDFGYPDFVLKKVAKKRKAKKV